MNQKIKTILKTSFVLVAFALSIQAMATWTAPASGPLSNNIQSPVNVGSLLQYKIGSLVTGGLRSTSFGLFDGQVRIGTAGVNPSASAILDLNSTTQGFLVPRVTTAQRNAITPCAPTPCTQIAPATGLQVFNTTTNQFEFWNGTAWTPVTPSGAVTSVFGRTGAVVATLNDYTWAQVNKATSSLVDITTRLISDTTGTLAVSRGGTGLTTLTANNLILGNGTSSPMFIAPNTSGNVLTSNGTTWASTANPVWSLVGNSGTTSTNFIGTTDNAPLVFKINLQLAGKIEPLMNPAGTVLLANTFFGYQSGNVNTGYSNVAIGFGALKSNTSGNQNTANGYMALSSNLTGGRNTAIGVNALTVNTVNNNTSVGDGSLSQNTLGANNTAVGLNALQNNISGNFNTAIGSGAGTNGGAFTNTTAIGYNALVGASNSLVLGGTGTSAVSVGIGTATPNTSSILDLTSTTRALIVPRMTKGQRNTIVSPIAGMVIYQTDGVQGLRTYNGTAWMRYTETID